jgi:outer membrane protein OmpA-like peptidoglycan-associated protein
VSTFNNDPFDTFWPPLLDVLFLILFVVFTAYIVLPKPKDIVPKPIRIDTPHTFAPAKAQFRSSVEKLALMDSLTIMFDDRLSDSTVRGKMERIIIEGHADAVPIKSPREGLKDNMDLSYHRAKLIDSLLIELNMVNQWYPDAIFSKLLCPSAFGERRLKINKQSAEPLNRRIEIVFKFHE